jgi:CTP:molybdopterin cytidylyltransferase MocA
MYARTRRIARFASTAQTPAVTRVVAIILHAVPAPGAGPLETAFAAARAANAARHARGFEAAGAVARIVETRAGGPPFGARLRRLAALDAGAGFVVLGSGSAPLATPADRRAFVAAAAGSGAALANNRYSSDVVAIPARAPLAELPDLTADNGLPRWLAERGHEVRDLRARWRLQVDLDSPLDVLVAGQAGRSDPAFERVRATIDRIRTLTRDPRAELLVAGRTSAATLAWLETATASRTRALVEERGMRTAAADQRPARSTLGIVLDREGPEALGGVLARLADAAAIDSRVLLAHRLGVDETGWPPAEDRFASDLLVPEGIADPWLRALTQAAADAPIPVLLGGHTLVGPGLRLLLGRRAP